MTTKTNAEESRYGVTEVLSALYDIKTDNMGLSDTTLDALHTLLNLCEQDYAFWHNKVEEHELKIDLEDKRTKVILDMAENRVVSDIKFYDNMAFCYLNDRVYQFNFVMCSRDLLSYQALS
jgi:hypothetical protein